MSLLAENGMYNLRNHCTIHEVDHMSGVQPENSGDVIHVDDDSAFSAYRDNTEDSDSSDVKG